MLTHYIFVRRDLPLGVLAAMVCHAAGESAAIYERREGFRDDPEVVFTGATAVVLEVKSEDHLKRIAEDLTIDGIDFIEIHESGGDFSGQFMAIGLVPIEREAIASKLREYQTLKTCLQTPDPMIKIAGLDND